MDRLDLTRQAGFIVTVYDEDGLRLAATAPLATPQQAFAEARKIVATTRLKARENSSPDRGKPQV